jgi:2,4-dienoyl-CoA reductase-like NADH-dependent reductase (Old Yellow Enzyme family)
MPHLFEPLTVRGVTLRNRIGVSPMCEYSSEDGFPNDWHFVHLGSRAVGGAGLVITEAAAVEARGRISPHDAGIWSDAHAEAWAKITRFIAEQGAVPGIQLAHAGRKASTARPWEGGKGLTDDQGGWEPVGPSALAFEPEYRLPHALSVGDIQDIQEAFVAAAKRSFTAGFRWVEIHAAHGYLMHEFLSPLSNHREDEYGGSFENRIRFTVDTAKAVRDAWPDDLPLAVRLSCTDWVEGGWNLEESVELSRRLKAVGVDLIDCSSGGNVPDAKIPVGAGYQVPFSEAIRHGADVSTATVGMITEPMQADELIRNGRADLVVLARELLRDPYWPLHAAHTLHQDKAASIPVQYTRAFPG